MTKAAPKRRRDSMSLYAFRLPDALIAEVDRVAQKLEAEQPGMAVGPVALLFETARHSAEREPLSPESASLAALRYRNRSGRG